MWKNYLIIAYRHLLKNKAFSFINITGLTIGMTACLLILYYVSFELSFDSFHQKW
jgi:putative ABC transport system permease protein